MINSKDIQSFILKHWLIKHHCPYVCSNFSGAGCEEMDAVVITKAGIMTEFEIKMSRGDFFADFKKEGKHRVYSGQGLEGHLDWFTCTRPNFFYYAVPKGLIKPEEVPEYAGLIYFSKYKITNDPEEYVEFTYVKKAPKLHREPVPDKVIRKIASVLSARFIHGCALLTYNNRQTA